MVKPQPLLLCTQLMLALLMEGHNKFYVIKIPEFQ